MRYAVIFEEGENGFGAYVPDLPGCIAAADTKEEIKRLIHEAIEFHIEGLKQDGEPIPNLPRVSNSSKLPPGIKFELQQK